MNALVNITNAVPVTLSPTGEDPFAVAFRPAQPTLDAVIELWGPLSWLNQQKRSRSALFDPEKAEWLLEMIPLAGRLYAVQRMFKEAEQDAAIEAWTHLAISLMIQSLPAAANVNDAYRHGLVNSMYCDPHVWGQYQPGFSGPVICRAIREARRTDDVPSPARFLDLCSKHRKWFKHAAHDCDELATLRGQAKEVVFGRYEREVPADFDIEF